ncbi:MAG: peptidoglycan-binding domain-containing protein [Chitinophagaceae bacterium]
MKAKESDKKPRTKKQKKKTLILTVFAVGAAGVLGYFGWQYWNKKKSGTQVKDNDPEEKFTLVSETGIKSNSPADDIFKPKTTAAAKKTKANDNVFPLKKGSRGDSVSQLQEALNTKYKASLKVDGIFGSRTEDALRKAGRPATVSESEFNVLVQGTSAAAADTASLGNELSAAVFKKDFNGALNALKKLKSTDDYSAANEVFKQYRLAGGVRQTIVNGLLSAFTKPDQKEKIKYEFLRVGLQYDGKKWSLSGLDGLPIITVVPATVWINAYKGVNVPARMVLGNEVCKRLDYTLFCNRGKYFLVHTNCVKPL